MQLAIVTRRLSTYKHRFRRHLLTALSQLPLKSFGGIEPIACSLDILKLGYYWKVMKSPTDSLAHSILKYRKATFLDFNKGLVHESVLVMTTLYINGTASLLLVLMAATPCPALLTHSIG